VIRVLVAEGHSEQYNPLDKIMAVWTTRQA